MPGPRRAIALLWILAVAGGTAFAASAQAPRLTPARAVASCAGAGPFWPTQTLAVGGGFAWVACKEQGRLMRVPLTSGRVRPVPVGGQPIAVLAAFGAVWALDSGGTIVRIDRRTARVTARVSTGAGRAFNLWSGAGSLWTVDDAGGEVLRVDPARRAVTARIAVGDGPSDLVFAGSRAWVINHRDRGLAVLDAATGRAERLVTLPGDAPERMALAAGSLWVTGRGTDLLRVDPATGEVLATVEIGSSGIDIVAAEGSLWVPSRKASVEQRGFPTMAVLQRIDPATGAVRTVARATRSVDVHGLVPYRRGVLLADNTAGLLYVVPR